MTDVPDPDPVLSAYVMAASDAAMAVYQATGFWPQGTSYTLCRPAFDRIWDLAKRGRQPFEIRLFDRGDRRTIRIGLRSAVTLHRELDVSVGSPGLQEIGTLGSLAAEHLEALGEHEDGTGCGRADCPGPAHHLIEAEDALTAAAQTLAAIRARKA